MTAMRLPVILISLSVGVAACAPVPAPSTPTATQAGCQPSQILPNKSGFPEVQGTMKSDGELWALLFFDKAQSTQDEKIVWRITGTTMQFKVQAQHEDGTIIRPIWGPEYHWESSWTRPGDEWGTGFNFPKPGCWTLTATSGATVGEIRLEVSAP